MNEAVVEQCAELGIEVPVASIERELRKLWEQDEARTNASLINLVVFSEKHGALVENSQLASELTREHACRVILVEIDRAAPTASLRAWITAHCHLAHGRKTVCCEQIAFHLTGRVTGRFRNTVFAHLVSDLPLVFWWQGELSDILTERLVSVMDRLIVDSKSWADPAASFRKLDEASEVNADLIIQDFAWTRTWQFRLGLASLFDDPAAGRALPRLRHVELRYHREHRNSALQLLAWLALQAGWQADGHAFTSAAGGKITVEIIAEETGPPISKLAVSAPDFEACVSQEPGGDLVRRRITAGNYEVISVAPADPDSPDELLAAQLSRGGRNALFLRVLPGFRKLLESNA